MTVKMSGPEGHGGLSHAGVSYEPDADGHIEVPHEAVGPAMEHGFTIVGESAKPVGDGAGEGAPDLTKLKKAELIAMAKEQFGLELDPALTNKQLIAEIETAQANRAAAGSTTDGDGAGEGAAA